MPAAPLPESEDRRLAELRGLDILDSLPERAYDDLAMLAAHIAGTPMALVSLVDADRQWFKASVGLDVAETPREQAFCAHALLQPDRALHVPDATADERFADNALVLGAPDLRFYLGAPLVTSSGMALGTLCVLDRAPREASPEVVTALRALARQVVAQLELRRELVESERLRREQVRTESRLRATQAQLQRSMASLAHQSVTDELTALPNRRAVRAHLADELERYRRYGTDLAVAMIDVDHFKRVNDQHGHHAGDDALVAVARVLEGLSRTTDLAGRYGGEEFVVVLPATDREGAKVIAERFRAGVEELRQGFPLTVSIGVAVPEADDESIDDVLARADASLYAAKALGRNQVQVAGTVASAPG